MKTKLLVIILLSCLIGCSSTVTFPLRVFLDETFSEEEIKQIDISFYQWNVATNGFVDYELIRNHPHGFKYPKNMYDTSVHAIYRLTGHEADDPSDGEDGWGAAAITIDGRNTVVMMDRIPDIDHFRRVMLHEDGHLFGIIGHTKPLDGPATMNPIINEVPDCLDSRSLQLFCDLYDNCKDMQPTCPE